MIQSEEEIIEHEINLKLDRLKERGYSKVKLLEIMIRNKMDNDKRLWFLDNWLKGGTA